MSFKVAEAERFVDSHCGTGVDGKLFGQHQPGDAAVWGSVGLG